MNPNPSLASVRAFTGTLYRFAPRRLVLVVSLLVASGLSEGLGLVLLVPLLALVGLPLEGGAPQTLEEAVRSFLGAVGLPLELGMALALFLLVIGARALLQRGARVQSAQLEEGLGAHLQERLYAAILGAGWVALVRERIPALTHALTVDVTRVTHATSFLLGGFSHLVVNVVFIGFALALAPGLTLFAGVIGLVLLVLGRHWNLRFRSSGEALTRAGRQVNAAVQDYLGTLKMAKSYGAEGRTLAIFSRHVRERMEVMVTVDRDFASAAGWIMFLAAALLCVLVYGAVEILALPATTLILLVLVFSRVVPRVLSLQGSYHQLLNALPGYANVMALTRRYEAVTERTEEPAQGKDGSEAEDAGGVGPEPTDATGTGGRVPATAARVEKARDSHGPVRPATEELREGVRLEGVRFAYASGEGEAPGAPVLQGLSLSIPANRTTALTGSSGAGKTTVADLVLGLLVPDQGRVLVDGRPLSPSGMARWRRRVGYVPQDGALLPETIRANLLWANPEATEDEMREALARAAALDFVERLPQGFDTVVGERGTLLSGGERQRLALACALVRRPALLILDEATSALDEVNEGRILASLAELHGSLTVFIISHRPSAVRDADGVYVLEDGQLVE